jgi:hypothetical protein
VVGRCGGDAWGEGAEEKEEGNNSGFNGHGRP